MSGKVLNNKLSIDSLEEIGFTDIGRCSFEGFEDMNYLVREGVCLFYNTPVHGLYDDSFYVGYADMLHGKYVAIAFRWISKLEELIPIYESIKGKNLI